MTQAVAEKETTEETEDFSGFWLQRARDIYSASSNYFDTNVRNRIIQDIRQFQGKHPLGSKYFTDAFKLKSKLFRPKTRATIRKNEAIAAAAFFSTEDVVAIRPVNDNDPLHVAAASMHKNLLQYRLTRPHPHGMPWFVTCMGAYQDAQAVGVVCSFQDWEYDKKKKIDRPDVTLLPVENYRFDPACDWRDPVNTSPYFIVMWPMYVKDVKARMRQGKWRYCSDSTILSATKSTSDTIRLQREQGTDSKDQRQAISDYTIVWVHQNFEEIDGLDVFYYTLGTEHLLESPQLVTERYPQGRPLAMGFSIVEAHKPYASSLPELTRDTQEEINEVANLRIDNIKLVLNKRYFVGRGQDVDLKSLTRNSPSSVTLMNNPNQSVKVVTTDDATASSYQEQDRLNLDFDDLAGVFSGSSVQSNRSMNETVGGMNLLSSNANQVSEYQLRTFTETWVEKVLRQLIVMEQHFESDATVLAVCGSQAEIEKQGFREVTEELLMQDVLLNVNVGVGAVNPQVQVERFTYGMKAIAGILGPSFLQQANAEEIVKELFGKLGYKDGKRFFKLQEGEDPRITQLMEQIQQLQAALKAKNPPELVAAQVKKTEAEAARADVESMLKRIEALYSAMQAAQTAVQVPGVTPVADAIAHSAGFQDQDAGTIYPQVDSPTQIPQQAQIPQSTSPLFPANPGRGMMTGIESRRVPGVQ